MERNTTRPFRILCVDDNVTICRLVALALTYAGYNVVIANDGLPGVLVASQPEI